MSTETGYLMLDTRKRKNRESCIENRARGKTPEFSTCGSPRDSLRRANGARF